MVPLVKVKLVTSVPLMPLPKVDWMFMLLSVGLNVLVREMPAPVVILNGATG